MKAGANASTSSTNATPARACGPRASLLYCPRDFVAQKGADHGYGRPCVPANEDVAFAYGYEDRKVPSASNPVT